MANPDLHANGCGKVGCTLNAQWVAAKHQIQLCLETRTVQVNGYNRPAYCCSSSFRAQSEENLQGLPGVFEILC